MNRHEFFQASRAETAKVYHRPNRAAGLTVSPPPTQYAMRQAAR
jgi:hypothetical protein